MSEIAYITGRPPDKAVPLSRYLPPIPDGVVAAWLQSNLMRQEGVVEAPWVLDPFGASPRVAVEAARVGYRVLVAANNPIARFLLEMVARPPGVEELSSALAELAASRKGDERLEPHIRSLYMTRCDQCKAEIMADAFLWDRGDAAEGAEKSAPFTPLPFARIYRCPYCNHSGEHPATDEDIARAAQYTSSGLHRARALERIAPVNDPDRHHAEEALAVYLGRAVYALFTIINRLDGMSMPPERRRNLMALLLSACDQSNTLWPHPSGRARPRALTIPPRFRENNIWLVLEQAVQQWSAEQDPIPLVTWPDLPPVEGGICIFEGRLKDLVANLEQKSIQAVISALPRPNQAFWTLSALWSGWLWGREAVGAFISVLRRRRYDWGWHTSALNAALESLAPVLQPGTPCLGLIGEAEPGFLSSALIAAELAGFDLLGTALPTEGGHAQINWARASEKTSPQRKSSSRWETVIRQATREYLQRRGEPSHYLSLHACALESLTGGDFIEDGTYPAADLLALLNSAIEEALSYRGGFIRYAGSDKSLEVGHWWLRETKGVEKPLSNRVEVELVRRLIAHPGITAQELSSQVCKLFPGLLTPDVELINLCLESYGEENPPKSGLWCIHPQDNPQERRQDLKQVSLCLHEIGEKLGYQSIGEEPLLWCDDQNAVVYAWYIIASALVSDPISQQIYPPEKSLIVFPGGRANLVAYKIQHDPRLRQAIDEGWRLVKFRQVRGLAQNPPQTRDAFENLITQDVVAYETPQLRLF